MLIQSHTKNSPEGNKNGNFFIWSGLNNQQLVKHLPPSIEKIVRTYGTRAQESPINKKVTIRSGK